MHRAPYEGETTARQRPLDTTWGTAPATGGVTAPMAGDWGQRRRSGPRADVPPAASGLSASSAHPVVAKVTGDAAEVAARGGGRDG